MNGMKKTKVLFPLLFLFFTAQGQEIDSLFSDSLQLQQELIRQENISNLSYQFRLMEEPSSELDSLFDFEETDSGWVSPKETDWAKLDSLHGVFVGYNPSLEYVIYEDIADQGGLENYLQTLIRTGDFVPGFDPNSNKIDLVLEASKDVFRPLHEYKLRILADYKLFWVTIIVLFFLITAALMITSMLIFKSQRNKRENLKKEYDELIIGPLTSLLFEKDLEEIKQISKLDLVEIFPEKLFDKPLFKQVMIERIIGLNKKMKGEFKDKLKAFYKATGLMDITRRNLKSKRWDIITTGLVQVNEMDLSELLQEVKKHTNSSNFHVRSQSGATLLNVSSTVNLDFLRDQKYPLSEWQQMNYLRIIKFVHNTKSLELDKLFRSENPSVRLFGIKLVRMLGRLDLLTGLKELSTKASDEEKIELLKTYETIGAHMEVDFINSCIQSENQELQLEAVKVAGQLGDEKSLQLIIGLFAHNPDFELKKSLMRSMYLLNPETFERYTKDQFSEEIVRIRAHILDPLLTHV
ncbi:HEAT repeat domain-containing protein [Algoriphagus hitonicola]|uniref:HEAT repeat-containing protein n=1 Tax=Algoriphagus hitonicola TaxID=435880 RepID=A0A1I2R7M9_9BACT|nr:HEAT repeat domain-containing protein [Algoriphagus hitonicola]SFG36472.1 hypothetical protein SAMN04487988_103108 [Algoriphagus hitonicola]